MKSNIKQLVPINENITPLLYCKTPEKKKGEKDTGKGVYFDAYAWNWNGYVALMEDDNEVKYLFTNGEKTANFDIPQFVKTLHCRYCGQRMTVDDIPWAAEEKTAGAIMFDKVMYRCFCGASCRYDRTKRKVVNQYKWLSLDVENEIDEPFTI